MDAQKTGKLINFLRSRKSLTQKRLAELVNVSDKAVSKWERGDGCPDVGILPNLAEVLETDVDSLLKGELPNRKLTKEEAEQMLREMEAQNQEAAMPKMDRQFIKSDAKITMYDFKRPDYFSKSQMHDIWICLAILCEKLKNDFASSRTDIYSVRIAAVDQMTNGEFMQVLPQRTFFYNYDYNNSGFAIEVAPNLGKQLLRQDLKKYPELLECDAEFLYIAYVSQFAEAMQKALYESTDKSVSFEDFKKPLVQKTLLPRSVNEEGGNMCMLVTLEIETDSFKANVNIQLSYYYCAAYLSKLGFFKHDDIKIRKLTDIKAKHSENNCFVELGRFLPEGNDFEPGSIFITDLKYGEPMNVVVGNDVRFKGEICAVDENYGIRISAVLSDDEVVRYDEEYYIALRLGGTYLCDEDMKKAGEGTVLALDCECGSPVEIIRDGKCAAYGEVVIVEDAFGVRIVDL